MLFNSIVFLVFLSVVLAFYYRLKSVGSQNAMLLVASYVFYGWWDWRFLSLISLLTLVNYLAALRIERSDTPRFRRVILTVALICDLGVLGFFKYYNFGVESIGAVMEMAGLQPHSSTLSIILPVGISFYTFQTMSYVIDVYRGVCRPARNLLNFALYVSYFPQLVAGPIEKAHHLLPQIEAARTITRRDLKLGVSWIILGYFKKTVIADSLAPMVDRVFADPNAVSGMISVIGVLAFAVQIYGDFAGYSLIARGVARLMGIHLIRNFRAPYLARNPRQFWERWHISLSSWLREYLYFGLGGSRKGRWATYRNLMVTMLLGGLWHGASWTFVLWGGYHGILLVACHALGVEKRAPASGRVRGILETAATFLLVLVGWLLFRVQGLDHLMVVVRNICLNFRYTPDLWLYATPTFSAFAILMAYHTWQELVGEEHVLMQSHPVVRDAAYMLMLLCVVAVGFHPVPFVYFQF